VYFFFSLKFDAYSLDFNFPIHVLEGYLLPVKFSGRVLERSGEAMDSNEYVHRQGWRPRN